MTLFVPYPQTVTQHTVIGDLRVYKGFPATRDDGTRDLLVWLPPNYETSNQRYPVMYMHDGQNVFDEHTSYSGEWRVDETMTQLHEEGLDAIIVAIPNAGAKRSLEYSPYPFRHDGQGYEGYGAKYVRWLVEQVKPFIDATFRTHTDAANTGIAGSSMGGLISLFGYVTYPHIFGLCGAFSTAYWFGENSLLRTLQEQASVHGKVYLDVGTREGDTLTGWSIQSKDNDAVYVHGVRDLRDELLATGYRHNDSLLYAEGEGALHREEAWAVRFPEAMRFLLGNK
jgi:predicted alpha/beta superfamily hydrolase